MKNRFLSKNPVNFPLQHHTTSMSAGGGFNGIWPRVNLLALNWFSSSGVILLSCENRVSDAPPADPAPAACGAAAFPNPPPVCPNTLPLPAEAAASDPKALANPPPGVVVEEKLNPEAEPNPEAAAGLLAGGAAKENEDAATAEEPAVEEPNPEGGCAGAAEGPPKAAGAEEPNPTAWAAKLNVSAVAGAGAPKPGWSERRLLV